MLVMPETLSPANVKPVDWSKCQPLSFIELLRPSSPYNQVSNGALAASPPCPPPAALNKLTVARGLVAGAAWRLALVAAMQKGTNKGVEQSLNVFTRENLDWTAAQMSTYKMVEAVGGFLSGRLVGSTLNIFGKRWAVVFGNLVSAGGWAAIGTAASTAQVLIGQVAMYPFGTYLRPSVETALTKHAVRDPDASHLFLLKFKKESDLKDRSIGWAGRGWDRPGYAARPARQPHRPRQDRRSPHLPSGLQGRRGARDPCGAVLPLLGLLPLQCAAALHRAQGPALDG